jgi:hypothetical protein
MKCYLAGAIDLVDLEYATHWRGRAKELASEFTDIIIVDPLDYDDPDGPIFAEQVVNTGKHLLAHSDVVLVDGRQPSWGTAMEVAWAHQLSIPVVVWGMTRDAAPLYLRYHTTLFEFLLSNAVLEAAGLGMPVV